MALDALTESISLNSLSDKRVCDLEASSDFSFSSSCNMIDYVTLRLSLSATRWVSMVPSKVNVFVGRWSWIDCILD